MADVPANESGVEIGGTGPGMARADAIEPLDLQRLVPLALAVLARAGLAVVPIAAPAQVPTLLDVEGVATALGCSRWTVYRLAAAGRIPTVRVGRKVRFQLEDVLAALRTNVSAPVATAPPVRPRASTAGRARPRAICSQEPRESSDHLDRLRSVTAATRRLGER